MNPEAQRATPDMRSLGVIGASEQMQPVLRSITQAASNGRPVLICGETGTGRGRIARSIHALAGCAPEAFAHLDCTATAADSQDEQLFGVNGGRRSRQPACTEKLSADGLLWRARHGTLYLANVVDAASPVQARLARLMRDGEATAPDGSRVRIDCRLMASVEPDFEHALSDGRFRRDLYTRLAALVISVPALRDRREDIPALAAFFLEQCAAAAGAPVKQMAAPAAMLLQALPWRGNAWELRGLIESLAQWVPGATIELADVLASVRLDPHARSVAVGGTLRAARRRFEREYIYAVLQQFGGQVPKAARALGIQRTNLYRKMRALGIGMPGNRFLPPLNDTHPGGHTHIAPQESQTTTDPDPAGEAD